MKRILILLMLALPSRAAIGLVGDSILNDAAPAIAAAFGSPVINRTLPGGETTQFLPRLSEFSNTLAIVNGGVNDLYRERTFASYQAAWQTAFTTAEAQSIRLVVVLMGPWETPNGTAARMVLRDEWRSWLSTAAQSAGAVVIDPDAFIGEPRPGTGGKLWNLINALQRDDVHWNPTGCELFASIAAAAVRPRVEIMDGLPRIVGGRADWFALESSVDLIAWARNDEGPFYRAVLMP